MKYVAFNGSPAGKNSATGKIIDAFLHGAEIAGGETEQIHLIDYKIQQCRGCFTCWFGTPGQCVLHDDMSILLKKYQQADVVCFGSPVYSWNMTGMLKNFVDRLVPLKSPLLSQTDGNYDMMDRKEREQKYVAISNCGFPGRNNFQIIQSAFSICNPTLEIYRNCGKLLTSQQPSVKPIVENYLETVQEAGYEMETLGETSEKTRSALNQPMMSNEEYVRFLGM